MSARRSLRKDAAILDIIEYCLESSTLRYSLQEGRVRYQDAAMLIEHMCDDVGEDFSQRLLRYDVQRFLVGQCAGDDLETGNVLSTTSFDVKFLPDVLCRFLQLNLDHEDLDVITQAVVK